MSRGVAATLAGQVWLRTSKTLLARKVNVVVFGLLLTVAVGMRLLFAIPDVRLNGDAEKRYHPIARNIVAGNGFSACSQPPYNPDSFDQPGYPCFVAAIYWLTTGSQKAVVIAQLIAEALILLLTVKLCERLGLPRRVQSVALRIGLICPFLPLFSTMILTEVVATLVTTLTCYLLVRSVTEGRIRWWLTGGLAGGVGLLVRPDLVVTVGLIAFATSCLYHNLHHQGTGKRVLALALGICAALLPWSARNYLLFHEVSPLGGVAMQTRSEYAAWLSTWVDDPRYQPAYWWGALDQSFPSEYPNDKIPENERLKAEQALRIAKSQSSFSGYPAQVFGELAAQARRDRPLTTFILAPLRRVAMTWFRMPGYFDNRLLKGLVYAFWVCLLGCVALGIFRLMLEKQQAMFIIVAPLIGRSLLPFLSGLAIEPRYMLEALPACFILAAFWLAGKSPASICPVSAEHSA